MKRPASLRHEISLYIDSTFSNCVYIDTIEKMLSAQRRKAEKTAEQIGWENVILYAVLEYDLPSQAMVSADLMNMIIRYDDYAELVDRINEGKRFFFIRGRKEYEYE